MIKSLNSKHVVDVDLIQLKKISIDLAKKVEQKGFLPEHILYVERAGLLVGIELSLFFNCPISGIRSSRSGGPMKSRFKLILRRLPRFVTHFLRKLEMNSSLHETNDERHISCPAPLPSKNKKILVVDDALDTGHTLKAVLNYLAANGFSMENIKSAVLTTTGEAPLIKADYSLFDQILCAFPWSYDSRQYDETRKKYKSIKKRIKASSKKEFKVNEYYR